MSICTDNATLPQRHTHATAEQRTLHTLIVFTGLCVWMCLSTATFLLLTLAVC